VIEEALEGFVVESSDVRDPAFIPGQESVMGLGRSLSGDDRGGRFDAVPYCGADPGRGQRIDECGSFADHQPVGANNPLRNVGLEGACPGRSSEAVGVKAREPHQCAACGR